MPAHKLFQQDLCINKLKTERVVQSAKQSISSAKQQRYFSHNHFVDKILLEKRLHSLATIDVKVFKALFLCKLDNLTCCSIGKLHMI